MKNFSQIIIVLLCNFLLVTLILGKDKIVEDTSKKSKEDEKSPISELSGTVLASESKDGNKKYLLQTADKIDVALPPKMADKEISYLPYENKQVLIKGNIETKWNGEGKVIEIKLKEILSIELKGVKQGEEKKLPSDQIREKANLGNQSDN